MVGDYFKVPRIHAMLHTTKVIYGHPVLDGAAMLFVRNTVRGAFTATVEKPIALFVQTPYPDPTWCFVPHVADFVVVLNNRRDMELSFVVSADEPARRLFRGSSASAFAEFGSRLRIHVGLLRGLTLRGSGWYRSPILLGWAV